jgi:hypothetical protein
MSHLQVDSTSSLEDGIRDDLTHGAQLPSTSDDLLHIAILTLTFVWIEFWPDILCIMMA